MGTTMHAHIEVKKDGKWLHYGCPDVSRDYLVFACVDGTRKNSFKDSAPSSYDRIRPVCGIHELPDDMSEVTSVCLEEDRDCGLKGFGVIYAPEIAALQKELKELMPSGLNDLEEDIFKTYIAGGSIAAHKGFEDVRIVFWYDN